MYNKSKTVRCGDYIWFRGKKVLWRTLSKHDRARATNDMKEDIRNNKPFNNKNTW